MGNTIKYKQYQFGDLKVNFRPGTEDEKVIDHSFENDIFYKEIPLFEPSENPVIIDVGAHIGTFSILTAIKYPKARIYAIEASKETFEILKKNVIDNNLLNVIPLHCAMSSVEGSIKLFHSIKEGNWGHSITKSISSSYEVTESITLQGLMKEYKFEHIDLIKFNCEGAEFDIISQSSSEVIKKIRSALILYHRDLNDKYDSKSLPRIFKKNNFLIKEIFKNSSKGRGWLIVHNMKYYSYYKIILQKLRNKIRL